MKDERFQEIVKENQVKEKKGKLKDGKNKKE